jgi:hypothetical protein
VFYILIKPEIDLFEIILALISLQLRRNCSISVAWDTHCFDCQTSCLDTNSVLGQSHCMEVDSVVENTRTFSGSHELFRVGYILCAVSLFLYLFLVGPNFEHRASVKLFVTHKFLNPKTVGRVAWTGDQPVARLLRINRNIK